MGGIGKSILKWLAPGEITRYLGFPFGLHIPQQKKDGKMLSQLRKHLFKWSNQKLSGWENHDIKSSSALVHMVFGLMYRPIW